MRILLVNTVPTERNGITNVMLNYLKAIGDKNIIFDWLSINEPENIYKEIVESRKGKLYVCPRSKKSIFNYFKKFRKIIITNKYDVVHIHGNSHTLILDLIICIIAKRKIRLVHSHNTSCNHRVIHKLLAPIFHLFYTHGFACGYAAGKWMFGNKPFTVINNGVDTNVFAFNSQIRNQYRLKLRYKSDNIVIGNVGYFSPVKNQSFIVDIFYELTKNNTQYRLLLIGEGELRTALQTKVRSLGIEDYVIFTGNVDNVADYLNAMDLILMPSLHEGLPLSLIEQQANGLTCVVSDAISKEVDKTGNVVFLPLESSASMWADYIELLQCHKDRSQKSQEAIDSIIRNGYCIRKEAEKLADVYNRYLNI